MAVLVEAHEFAGWHLRSSVAEEAGVGDLLALDALLKSERLEPLDVPAAAVNSRLKHFAGVNTEGMSVAGVFPRWPLGAVWRDRTGEVVANRLIDDLADEATAVNALLGTSYTGATLPILQDLTSLSGNSINFTPLLTGVSVLAVHVGGAVGAGGIGYNGTAFFRVVNGGDILTLNLPGLSNARLFTNGGVPEPATWLMMILGFAGIGLTMRKRNGAHQARVRFA